MAEAYREFAAWQVLAKKEAKVALAATPRRLLTRPVLPYAGRLPTEEEKRESENTIILLYITAGKL